MRLIIILFLFVNLFASGQVRKKVPLKDGVPPIVNQNSTNNENPVAVNSEQAKPTIDLFRYLNTKRDTTYIDTSLTIQKEYEHNYLRRDLFGMLPFANEGQVYNHLKFSQMESASTPEMGFRAKHFNYMGINNIPYFSVAQPYSEIFYRSVMEQGQVLDAQIALNTSPQLNFYMGYKGTRSLGKYINQLSSHGNFRFSSHYHSKNNRYHLFSHFTGQDLSNQENGGIINTNAFENNDPRFDDRPRFDVYLKDGRSFLKGHRIYVNQHYHLSKNGFFKDLSLFHLFSYEYKMFQYTQNTINSQVDDVSFSRFGNSFLSSNINNETRFEHLNQSLGLRYNHSKLGAFEFSINQIENEQIYNRILFLNENFIPNGLKESISLISGNYEFDWKGFQIVSNFKQSITNQGISDFSTNVSYLLKDNHHYDFGYRIHTQVADYMTRLHQSSFEHYNWFLNFKTQKNVTVFGSMMTPLFNLEMELSQLNDFFYLSNDAPLEEDSRFQQILVSPKQFEESISHFSLKASKELKYKKFAFDSTILFQNADQSQDILNVPQWTTRNTLYYANHFYKKALYLQTGITAHYFSSFYANDYNPIIGSFFIQNQKKIGNYPVFDFFVNAKIRTFRVFIKAEHINSSIASTPYYAAPNQPYRDFIIRFGLTWTFFQ